tara:strand:+ start:3093 stop:5294 length:2202 start_codon:yes stop_codon:yes gene_type:complete
MSNSDVRDYVRPPILKFKMINQNKDYKEYKIKTDLFTKKKDNKESILTNYLNSFIFCNPNLSIKMPSKSTMITKSKKNFAYAFGLFPNPKTGKSSYLDGCILGALGLKRQKTHADVICFVTHDVSEDDIKKLEVVFDKVIRVPYISPFDMGGEGDLKTIKMDKDIFKNCNNYTKNHPYSHVFFKLHIFNPDLFPYKKVCFVDSDLVPLNYYDSLFMLDTPAGWVEYRKKFPYLESFNWDRCDFLKHGQKIPKLFTDINKPGGADVNAGLLVVTPNKKEYDEMIKEITSPLDTWMGKDKFHKGFYDFDFNTSKGTKFVKDSYCFPEQNYLTKRYSGKWNYVEFAFQSWSLDPCNSFGIHMAAFNPKPWFKQPSKGLIVSKKKENIGYEKSKKNDIIIALAIREYDNFNYENVSYTYEIFNDLIIWGLIIFPELTEYFLENTEICGTKKSATEDNFEYIDKQNNIKSVKFREIEIGDNIYKKLSLSQQYIVKLLTDYDKYKDKIKDNYLSICKTKIKNKINELDYDFTIIKYPDYKTSKKYDIKTKKSKKKGGSKKKSIPKLRVLNYKNKKHKYSLKDPQKKRILAINEGIKSESKKTKKSIKKAAVAKKARFNVLRIYRKNNNPKDCKKITKDMKYIDKKYKLGETKDICNKKKQKGGGDEKTVIYYYKNGCPACEKFNEDWGKLKKEKKTWDCKEIEYSDNINPEHKKLIETVPAIFINDELYNENRSNLFDM